MIPPLPETERVVILRDMKASEPIVVVHVFAELAGIDSTRLHDRALLGGLLIAAAGAAGLHAAHAPVLHHDAMRGVDALLLLDGGHAAMHSYAEDETLFIDIVAPQSADLDKALAVFTRRLLPTFTNTERAVRSGGPRR